MRLSLEARRQLTHDRSLCGEVFEGIGANEQDDGPLRSDHFRSAQAFQRRHRVARLLGLDLSGVEFEARLIGNGQTYHG